jgi:hypothetical protein
MHNRDPGGLGLWYEFYRDAGDLAGRAEGKCVLQQPWRLRLEHLAVNIGTALAIGPCKDDAVRFGGDDALPDFIRRCGDEV